MTKEQVGRFIQLLRIELAKEATSEWFSDQVRFKRSVDAIIGRAEYSLDGENSRTPRFLYELTCRNLLVGAYLGNGEFIGIREKCGTFRLDVEGNVQQAIPINLSVPEVLGDLGRDNRALFDFLAKIDGARTSRVITFGPREGEFEVIVGNIGCVYLGDDREEALSTFNVYVEQSKSTAGRAGGESVTMTKDGEPIREYAPTRASEE